MIHFHYLEKGQILRFEKATQITLLSGEVWITRENDLKDHVLQASEKINNPASSLMLVEALENSNLLYSAQELDLSLEPQAGTRDISEEAEAFVSKAWSLNSARVAGDQEQF
ncbi:MAG: DUF2917 domain-containing protein [Pseudobdellovibrionaceae bacterium]